MSQVRPEPWVVQGYFDQLRDALGTLVQAGLVHGDLSPYNTMVHGGRLVMIDLPQIVDVIANPRGGEFIARDVRNVANWFRSRGLTIDEEELIERLLFEAGLR